MIRKFSWILILAAWTGLFTLSGLQAQMAGDPQIDVEHYDIQVEIEPERSFMQGLVKTRFTVLEESLHLSFDLNRRLSIIGVRDEAGQEYSLSGDDFSRDRIRVQGSEPFSEGEQYQLHFEFEGALEREQYAFLDVPFKGKALIDANGALLLSEGNWFPSHRLPVDPASTEMRVTVPLGFTAVAPGTLQPVETVGISEVFTWVSQASVSRVPLVVSRFFRQSFEEGPLPLTFYVTEDFDKDLQPLAEKIDKVISFMQSEYGPSPMEKLALVQVGNVDLTSTGARGLMFLDQEILEQADPPIMDLARRVAEQWWGSAVRFARSSDAWLRDGFATYSALRYVETNMPERFENELSRLAVDTLKYQDTAPVVSGLELEVGSPKYDSIVASKGSWVLYMLGQLMGRDKLHQALRDWYRQSAGSTVSTPDFARFIQDRTEEDYNWFFVQWVESVGVPEFELEYTILKITEGGFKIRGQVKQNLELFKMPMDVAIETKGQPEEKHVNISGKSTSFEFETETMPLRLELDPHGKILMDSERRQVAVHVALGEEYKNQGEYVSAVQEFEKATSMNPRSSLAHFRLGEVFFEQHSYSNAANSFREALNGDLKPEWVETWVHIYLGKVYDILGQRQRALAEYTKARNSKIDYRGAQAEAEKYMDEPYTKPSSVIG